MPGQAGSTNPPQPDWIARKLRQLDQQVEQLRGQVSQLSTSLTATSVVNVVVQGSTLTVTFGNGTTESYAIP